MKKLPKPKAVFIEGVWLVHYPGTYSKYAHTLQVAYLLWEHCNWTRSRIMRTV
jgi:hypothetical protein